MNEDFNNEMQQTAQQPMQQPVQQPVPVYDPYIYRLQQQEQTMKPEKKQMSFFGRFLLLVGAAVLFGALAGGAFLGVKELDRRFGKKDETPIEQPDEGTSELDTQKSKNGVVLQASNEIHAPLNKLLKEELTIP